MPVPSEMQQVVILGYARTAFGSFGGSLAHLPAPSLAAAAIRGAVERAKLPPGAVQEVILGNVVPAGMGQAPARQASRAAGLPDSARVTAVGKVRARSRRRRCSARGARARSDCVLTSCSAHHSAPPGAAPPPTIAGLRLWHEGHLPGCAVHRAGPL